MRFIDIINSLEGYVNIQAEGVFLERFLNICTHRNLNIRNIKRCGAQRLTADISVDSFKRLRPVCSRTKTSVKILKRQGLPFIAHRYRKRKATIIGLCLAILILWYTSGHIMGITVFGNQRISTETILSNLARSGVSLGKTARRLDSATIRNQMMRDIDELAWVGINVSGSRVYVEIVERLEKEPGIEIDQPCSLIAKKDGIIESVEARNGQSMVKNGDGVREGDVLVSGVVDNPAVGFRYVHAYGEVFAITSYTEVGEYLLEYDEEIETGAEKSRYTLKILDKEFPLFLGKGEPYENSEVIIDENEYRLPIDFLPSVFIGKETFKERETRRSKRTSAEALEVAKTELIEKLHNEIPDEAIIVNQEISQNLTERGSLEVSITLYCRENIAVEALIEKSDEAENTGEE